MARSFLVRSSWSLPLSLSLLLVLPSGGCGLSGQINGTISDKERSLQRDAAQLMLSQMDVLVVRVKDVVPVSDAAIPLPGSQCTLRYTDTMDEKSLRVASAPCEISLPEQGRDFSARATLAALTLSARRMGAVWTLAGEGQLDISAELPVFGEYKGVARYSITNSSVNVQTQSIELHLTISYMSGQSAVALKVDVSGTAQRIMGSVAGPDLMCTVSGSLKSPAIKCM
jgi:hypothetical protein